MAKRDLRITSNEIANLINHSESEAAQQLFEKEIVLLDADEVAVLRDEIKRKTN